MIKVKHEAKIVSNTAFLKNSSTWAIAVAGTGKFSSYCQEQSRDPCYENKPKTPVLLVYCSCRLSKALCLHPTHSLNPLSPHIEMWARWLFVPKLFDLCFRKFHHQRSKKIVKCVLLTPRLIWYLGEAISSYYSVFWYKRCWVGGSNVTPSGKLPRVFSSSLILLIQPGCSWTIS